MIAALAVVTGRDERLNLKVLSTYAHKLVTAQYTSKKILQYYGDGNGKGNSWWYQSDWRGRRRQRPTLEQICETVQAARDQDTKKSANSVHKHGDGSYDL